MVTITKMVAATTAGTKGAMPRSYYELPPYLDLHQYWDEFCDDYNDKV